MFVRHKLLVCSRINRRFAVSGECKKKKKNMSLSMGVLCCFHQRQYIALSCYFFLAHVLLGVLTCGQSLLYQCLRKLFRWSKSKSFTKNEWMLYKKKCVCFQWHCRYCCHCYRRSCSESQCVCIQRITNKTNKHTERQSAQPENSFVWPSFAQ